jgi:hypothetical protein
VAVGYASHTFGSLAGNTRYYAWVTADCGSDVSMEATISFVTNPDCGGATHSDEADSMSLYITSDNGLTHGYIRTQSTHAYAYRAFDMTSTQYHISYDWLARGERGYDFMRVFLVPSVTSFTPGYNPLGTFATTSFGSTVPTGWIALDNASALAGVETWQHFDTDFEIPTPGEYYLLFYWLNDGSGGTQPPAAVDNISIVQRGCPTISSLAEQQLTSTSVTLTAIFDANVGIVTPAGDNIHLGLYPNLASNTVTITCGQPATVVLVDMYGREALRCSVEPSLPTTLSVNHLLSGVYFVRLADTPNGPVRKLIIQ